MSFAAETAETWEEFHMKRTTSKSLSVLLAAAMAVGTIGAVGTPTAAAAGSSYGDTQGHWAESAIQRWSNYGVISGYDANTFRPNASITRGQMAKILSNALNLSESAGNPFSDVKASDWYAPFVSRCYAAGIMQGNNGMANPNSTITRQQAMTMLARALGIAPETNADLSAFTDRGQVADYAAPYVAAMIHAGMVNGTGNNQLSPTGSMSRAALVSVLDRAVVQYITQPGTYTLSTEDGIILVASSNVTLNGTTSADIVITPAANNGTIAFENATVRGTVTVLGNYVSVTTKDSSVPNVTLSGKGSTVKEATAGSTSGSKGQAGATGGGGSSSGGNSGSNGGTTTPDSNVITEDGAVVENKTYNSGLTIGKELGNGDVTLKNVRINGDLTIQGGGENSIHLYSCYISGKVVMDKDRMSYYDNTEYYNNFTMPRLVLNDTPIRNLFVKQPATLEAEDGASSNITQVLAYADVDMKGTSTVNTLVIPEDADGLVNVTVMGDSSVAYLTANNEAYITGTDNGSVKEVTANVSISVDVSVVDTINVPAYAENVVLDLSTSDPTSDNKITINNESTSTIVAADDDVSYEVKGEDVKEHEHNWDNGVMTKDVTCTEDGELTFTCLTKDCPVGTRVEVIPATGHAWDNGVVTKEATCTEAGEKTYTCQNDQSHTKKEAIPALGHAFSDKWESDETAHWHVCSRDEAISDKAEHTFNENGVCTVCGYEKASTPDTPDTPDTPSEITVSALTITGDGANLLVNLTTSAENDENTYTIKFSTPESDSLGYYERTTDDNKFYYESYDFVANAVKSKEAVSAKIPTASNNTAISGELKTVNVTILNGDETVATITCVGTITVTNGQATGTLTYTKSSSTDAE